MYHPTDSSSTESQPLQHKLAAILYADVEGYSRLTGADEAGTHRTLSSYLDLFTDTIKTHRGDVKHYAGDAVLADFTTVSDALNCAVAVQQAIQQKNATVQADKRIQFRIGINLGEVIVDRGEVYGNGVNVAARLETLAEPGGICISGAARDAVGGKLPLAYDFLGEQAVKNIAEPVRAYRVNSEGHVKVATPATQKQPQRFSTGIAIGAVIFAALIAAAGIYSYRHAASPPPAPATTTHALPLPDKPSIAVLPFVNMSDDPKQEYFSDGMTEDVITSLSKRSGLFVIARNSVFTYKGHAVKPEQVGRELGVRYVLEGSVRKAEKQVRITAQLIDASNGYHLWAEHYDGELKDIFALQDSITQKIVAALGPKLTAVEQSLSGRAETTSIEAYDLVLRGVAMIRQYTKDSILTARQMCEQAIALDPNYARAYARVAWTYWNEWYFQWTSGSGAQDRALEIAKKAVAVDDTSSEAHLTLGWNLLWKKQHDLGVAQLEKAVALDPNFSEAYAHLGQALNYSARPDEAIGFIKKAMRLDPNYPPWFVFFLGKSYWLLRQNDEAVVALQEAIRRSPDFLPARDLLAVVYIEMGQEKQAKAEAAEVIRIDPTHSVSWLQSVLPYKKQADLERFISGQRKAGFK